MVPVCSCHSLSSNCHPATVAGSKMEEFWLRRLLLGLALFLLVFSVNLNMTFQFRRLQSFRFGFPQFRQYRLWWAWKLRPKLANFVAVGRVLWQEFTVGMGSRLGCFTTFTVFAIIGSLLCNCARRLSIAEVAGRSCWLLMIVRNALWIQPVSLLESPYIWCQCSQTGFATQKVQNKLVGNDIVSVGFNFCQHLIASLTWTE